MAARAPVKLEVAAGSRSVSPRPAPDWHLPIPGGSHPQLVEVQRSRLLSATIRAVEELGSQNMSVSDITRRARVSRRTFYELFADREACLLAALEGAAESVEKELATLDFGGLAWCERVRLGLWAILSFFDREPALARACVRERFVRARRHRRRMWSRGRKKTKKGSAAFGPRSLSLSTPSVAD